MTPGLRAAITAFAWRSVGITALEVMSPASPRSYANACRTAASTRCDDSGAIAIELGAVLPAVDHALDRHARSCGDGRIDVHFRRFRLERMQNVLQLDLLHERAQVARL